MFLNSEFFKDDFRYKSPKNPTKIGFHEVNLIKSYHLYFQCSLFIEK